MELDISLIEDMLTVTGWTRFHSFLFLNSFSGYFFASLWLTHLHLLHATVYPLSNLTKISEIWTLIFRLCIAIGAVIWGWLADRYGRNIAARTSILTLFTFSFLSVFGRCEWEMVGCVMGMGLGIGGEMVSGGVILSEYLPRNKIHVVLMSTAGMSFGALIGVGLYEGIKEINVIQIETWRLIFAVNAGMEVILLLMKLRMEETPKFLWKRDKQVEAEKLIDMDSIKSLEFERSHPFNTITPIPNSNISSDILSIEIPQNSPPKLLSGKKTQGLFILSTSILCYSLALHGYSYLISQYENYTIYDTIISNTSNQYSGALLGVVICFILCSTGFHIKKLASWASFVSAAIILISLASFGVVNMMIYRGIEFLVMGGRLGCMIVLYIELYETECRCTGLGIGIFIIELGAILISILWKVLLYNKAAWIMVSLLVLAECTGGWILRKSLVILND